MATENANALGVHWQSPTLPVRNRVRKVTVVLTLFANGGHPWPCVNESVVNGQRRPLTVANRQCVSELSIQYSSVLDHY